MQCADFKTANKLIKDKNLQSKGYKIYIPRSFLISSGVVNNIPASVDIVNLKNKLRCVGQFASAKIDSVEMMFKWNKDTKELDPCDKIIVHFRSQKLPLNIEIYFALYKVILYTLKPMLC